MAAVRAILRNWVIGFALGFLVVNRFSSEMGRLRSGFTVASLLAVATMVRSRRGSKRGGSGDAEETETEAISV